MEHQHAMQNRMPIQSHNMPPQRSHRRSGSGGGRVYQSPTAAAVENTNTGHIIQSRSTSLSHGLTKRARSRSRRKQQQGHPSNVSISGRRTPQESSISNNSDGQISAEPNANPASFHSQMKRSSSTENVNAVSGTNNDAGVPHDEHGRCIRHPNIELRYRDTATSSWRVVLHDCPLCSYALEVSNKIMNDGACSSQATGTRTLTTEESSVKSWTMSDASNSDTESNYNNFRGMQSSTPERMKARPPTPPRRSSPNPAFNHMAPPQDNNTINRVNHRSRHHNDEQQNPTIDPIQSLKELGRKLVMESEAVAGASFPSDDAFTGMQPQASSTRLRRPPPPPRPGAHIHQGQNQRDNENMIQRNSSLHKKELNQTIRRQQKARPPPRRGTPGPTRAEETNENILGEASDIIARMESLTVEGEATFSRSRKSPQAQRQQMNLLEGEAEFVMAAAEKRARSHHRQEKAERKAARHRAREERKMQQQYAMGEGGHTCTLPMNDAMSPSRGREKGTEDILQAAARIRARALRSTSRSRERVREAAVFCGETPADNNDVEEGGDHMSFSFEKKRSILNPHGLGDQPSTHAMGRRSQERSQSGGRAGSHGRDRNTENFEMACTTNQPTSAQEILSRRRELRQKIAERQSNAQSRMDHRRQGSGGPREQAAGDDLSLKQEVMEEWARVPNSDAGSTSRRSRRGEGRGERRGRSRSAVRGGIAKIRSLSAFRKRDKGIDLEDYESKNYSDESQTIDTSKQSTSSFKRLISKGKPRSLSRVRRAQSTNGEDSKNYSDESQTIDTSKRSMSSFKRLISKGKPQSLSRGRRAQSTNEEGRSGDAHGWAANLESSAVNDDIQHDRYPSNYEERHAEMDTWSAAELDSFARQSSRYGALKKSLLKKKQSRGGGVIRSLSRGSFREDDRSFTYNETFGESTMGSIG